MTSGKSPAGPPIAPQSEDRLSKRQSGQPHRTRYWVLNGVLAFLAVLLAAQSLAARSVSSGWDLGLLLPLLAAGFLILYVGLRIARGGRLLTAPRLHKTAIWLFGAGAALFLTVQILLIAEPLLHGSRRLAQSRETLREPAWVIVLGCGIKPDGTPSWALANRLDAALGWYRENPGSRLIVSGGQGSNEPIPEALSMARYLYARGIPKEDVLMEDRSTSTMENFQYSVDILRRQGWNGEPVLFATNDFHLFRARILAGRNGLDAYGIGAPTPPIIRPNVYAREFFALFKSLAVDWPVVHPERPTTDQ